MKSDRKLRPRHLTDKLQIKGYNLLARRIESAFISWDVRGLPTPFTKEFTAVLLGMALTILMFVGGVVVGFFSPSGKVDDAKILATKGGSSRYVVIDGRAHPVTNLASARLIAGTNAEPKVVSESELAKLSRGQLMGIPSAPDEMIARTDETGVWAVCSQYDSSGELELTKTNTTSTVVLAGDDAIAAGNRKVGPGNAVLVTSSAAAASASGTPDTWLLLDGHRIAIDDSEPALESALKITEEQKAAAPRVSADFIDAVPEWAAPQSPRLDKDGQSSSALSDYNVGDVLGVEGTEGRSFWLVLDDGVQQLTDFAATFLVDAGAVLETGVSSSTVAAADRVKGVDISRWPSVAPSISTVADTVCVQWSRRRGGTGEATILAGQGMPMTDTDRRQVTWLLPARGSTAQADAFYTRPGKGWLVLATGSTRNSHTAGQLWWVSDTGVRFAIEGDDDTKIDKVLEILGVTGSEPQRVPWSVLSLLPAGNSLSPASARVVHATIPPEMAQALQPKEKELK